MGSTTQTASSDVKELVRYRVESGVAVITMSDPPANTYSYEMNRQLDDAILCRADGQRRLRYCPDRSG